MQSAYAVYQQRLGGYRLPPMEVDYRLEISSYPSWVVDSEGEILGGLIMDFDDDQASIANIAIAPASQGKGIGGALMKFAEAQARAKGFAELQLATHQLLEENLSLYRHLGWRESASNGDRVTLKKPL